MSLKFLLSARIIYFFDFEEVYCRASRFDFKFERLKLACVRCQNLQKFFCFWLQEINNLLFGAIFRMGINQFGRTTIHFSTSSFASLRETRFFNQFYFIIII